MTALLKPAEAAARLGRHPKTVTDMCASGELPAIHNGKTGNGRRWWIRDTDLERWIDSQPSNAA